MTLNELTYIIRGCIFEVHKNLGPGLLESIYEEALVIELQERGLQVERQVSIPVIYKGKSLNTNLRIDILVNKSVIVELKSVEELIPIYYKQLISYLVLTNLHVGYLVNFNTTRIDSNSCRRVYNNYYEKD